LRRNHQPERNIDGNQGDARDEAAEVPLPRDVSAYFKGEDLEQAAAVHRERENAEHDGERRALDERSSDEEANPSEDEGRAAVVHRVRWPEEPQREAADEHDPERHDKPRSKTARHDHGARAEEGQRVARNVRDGEVNPRRCEDTDETSGYIARLDPNLRHRTTRQQVYRGDDPHRAETEPKHGSFGERRADAAR
jgi:hypothetical protein